VLFSAPSGNKAEEVKRKQEENLRKLAELTSRISKLGGSSSSSNDELKKRQESVLNNLGGLGKKLCLCAVRVSIFASYTFILLLTSNPHLVVGKDSRSDSFFFLFFCWG
jgi:hypothetical protein